jgi:hypothetical protein
MLNSGYDQPIANTCVASVAAATLFVRVVLITQLVSLSSSFHINTGSIRFMLFLYISNEMGRACGSYGRG